MNILIGITSSIAAYKINELVRLYKKNNHEVKVVLTPNALKFVSVLTLETLSNNKVYFELFESRGEVEHISLADWADIFVLAPASANTVSKIANGICDNLLSSVFCAFLGSKKPTLVAPAMNEGMWENPVIKLNIKKLKSANCKIVEPESGFLACGTEGKGRLASIDLIYQESVRLLYQDKKNNNKKILVTIGGTKEKIDSVRYITNLSSGKMGRALADCAYTLGYDVIALSTFQYDAPYKVIEAQSALDMMNELLEVDFDYLFMAAAVSDFKAKDEQDTKISKENIKKDSDGTVNLKLALNPDIVKIMCENKKQNQIITGFCLADTNLISTAKRKLKDKKLDYIIANDVKIALDKDENEVSIISKSGKMVDIKKDKKDVIAKQIINIVCGGKL